MPASSTPTVALTLVLLLPGLVQGAHEIRGGLLQPLISLLQALLDVLAHARAQQDGPLPGGELDDQLVPWCELKEAPNRGRGIR